MAAMPVLLPMAPGGGAGRAGAAPAGQTGLLLASQSTWIGPGQDFDVQLTAGSAAPPVADRAISVAVYPCLHTRSNFDQTVGTPSQLGTPQAETTTPLTWRSLPVATGGAADLRIAVTVDGSSVGVTTPPAGAALAVGLSCHAADGGVFPVRITLSDQRTGNDVASLVTHLVYLSSPGSQPLRAALVLPVAATVTAAPPVLGARAIEPTTALRRVPAAVLGDLATEVADVAYADLPMTLAVSPQSVLALAGSGHQRTVTALATLSSGSTVEVPAPGYVPVDATALVRGGVGSDLTLQVHQGTQVLRAAGLHVTDPTADPTAGGGAGATWIASGSMDSSALESLAALGYRTIVVPEGSLRTTSAGSGGSTSPPETVTTPQGTVTLLASSADLTQRFAGRDPVLAAHQLLAELTQIYLEAPNLVHAREVVIVPPAGWTPEPAFVQTLLAGLQHNPALSPVTIAGARQAVPPVSGELATGVPVPAVPGPSILAAKADLASFAAAIPATALSPDGKPLITELQELRLSAEAATLRPGQQADVVRAAQRALTAQVDQVGVAVGQSITLTARKGRIPVTLVNEAGYPVTGTLTLTSDKLLFSSGTTRLSVPHVTLNRANNAVYVSVEARASGEFRVSVAFDAPTGRLPLAAGTIIVRSTATSVVGIVLSLGAVAVLLGWWLRTARRSRNGNGGPDGAPAP